MKDLLKFLKNYKKELVFGPFFKLLEAIFELMVPMVMAKIIDKGIANGDTGYILRMSGLIVVLGVCGLGFALTCQFLAARCAYGFGTELREALYRHINSLSYESIDRIGTSSLVNRLTNDTNTVQNGVNMFIRLAVRAPFLIIGAVVMAVTIDWKLSGVMFIAAPLISAVIFFIMRRTVPMYKRTQQLLDRASTLTRENLEGTRVIRAFSRQQEEIDEKVNQMNEAYVFIGDKNALKKAGLIGGGSLLKKSKLNTSNIDKKLFKKVDIRNVKNFQIPDSKPEVLTQMPAGSYEITKTGNNSSELTITDPARFWGVSRFLIIRY